MSQVITFEDGIGFLKRHSIRLSIAGLAGAVIGLGLTFVMPKQWEATGVLQVGQIASDTGAPMQIEATGRAMERLKLDQFQDAVLRRLKLPLEIGESRETDLLRDSSKISVLRNADLIEIKMRGYSPEEAKRYTQAYGEELIEVHSVLAKPSLDKMKADLADITASLTMQEQRGKEVAALIEARTSAGIAAKFSENVLLNDIAGDNERQLRQLRLQKNHVAEKLSPERTFNTRFLGPIDITRRPVFPKRSIFAATGLMLGVFLAFAAALWRERAALVETKQY